MNGGAPLATQLVTTMSVAAAMVYAGLRKRRLERRPQPRMTLHVWLRRRTR